MSVFSSSESGFWSGRRWTASVRLVCNGSVVDSCWTLLCDVAFIRGKRKPAVRDEYHTQSYEWMQQSSDLCYSHSNYASCLEPDYCVTERRHRYCVPRYRDVQYPMVILWWSLYLYSDWLPYSCTAAFDFFLVDTSKNTMMLPWYYVQDR